MEEPIQSPNACPVRNIENQRRIILFALPGVKKISNRSQSICQIVSVYRVLQMQGGGHADVLMYFKCPPDRATVGGGAILKT